MRRGSGFRRSGGRRVPGRSRHSRRAQPCRVLALVVDPREEPGEEHFVESGTQAAGAQFSDGQREQAQQRGATRQGLVHPVHEKELAAAGEYEQPVLPALVGQYLKPGQEVGHPLDLVEDGRRRGNRRENAPDPPARSDATAVTRGSRRPGRGTPPGRAWSSPIAAAPVTVTKGYWPNSAWRRGVMVRGIMGVANMEMLYSYCPYCHSDLGTPGDVVAFSDQREQGHRTENRNPDERRQSSSQGVRSHPKQRRAPARSGLLNCTVNR